jgi:predicted MFS family arabinose efflux permease
MLQPPRPAKDGRLLGLLAGSTVDAVLVFWILGYGVLYAHQHFHASDAVASQAAAIPGLAWFLGAWLWGMAARRIGYVRVAALALLSYGLSGLVIWLVGNGLEFVALLGGMALLTGGFRPAVVGHLIQDAAGGAGARLARRVRWQSVGWLGGGIAGGLVYAASPLGYPIFMTAMAVTATALGVWLWRRPTDPVPETGRPEPRFPGAARQGIAVLIPYFLAYSAIEGVVTTLGLFLTALHLSSGWVGGSTTLRTAVGLIAAAWYGRWADRWGGRRFVARLLVGFAGVLAVMAAFPEPVLVIGLFAVVLNSPLTVGVQLVLADTVSRDTYAVALGWVQSTSGLAIFLGTTVLGLAAGWLGPRALPALAAGLMGMAAVWWALGPGRGHSRRALAESHLGRGWS